MLDHAQAREIAQKWLDKNCRIEDDRFLVRDEFTQEHSFGWVFFTIASGGSRHATSSMRLQATRH
jgi:hypothetical protein